MSETVRPSAFTRRSFAPGPTSWHYSAAELWADGAVHVIGVVLVVAAALIFLLTLASDALPSAEIAAVAVYLMTLVLSFGVSAFYNIWPVSPVKWFLRRLDHSAIYLLIAGTYTPFMTRLGWWEMLGAVWAVALFGITLKIAMPGRYDRLSVGLYLLLGWAGVLAYGPVVAAFPSSVIWMILGGGLVYSGGVIFHLAERMHFHNAVWHAFVLAAASMHFLAVSALAGA